MGYGVVEDRRQGQFPDGDLHPAQVRAASAAVPVLPSRHASVDTDLRALLEPMLDAVQRLAGADAATLRVGCGDDSGTEAVLSAGGGLALDERGEALPAWCRSCDESRRAESACVRSDLCGHDDHIPADAFGAVCSHIVTVPLRHRGRRVGAVNLLFAAPCALPAAMTPLLQATGDLIGVALENARLARENLRIRLGAERQMLASEVHDSLAQGLTYMRLRMSLLRDAIGRGDRPAALKCWADVDDTLGNSHRRLRELITYFRSQMDPRGLAHALCDAVEAFPDRTGIGVDFANRVPDLCLAPEREIEVFHIVQEALANVARHAHAQRATVSVERCGGEYRVAVEDDGVGIAASATGADADLTGHYGLAIMRERARRLGGRLTIQPGSHGGTRVELAFPADPPSNPAQP